MNLSRRSLLRGLFAAPAVIAADRLMPIKLWLPTIYGDAIHDDYEGIMAWFKGEKVNILPKGTYRHGNVFNLGGGVYRVSKGINYPGGYSLFGSESGQTTIQADPGVDYVVGVEYDDGESGTLGNIGIQSSEQVRERGRWPFHYENMIISKRA